MAHSFSFGDVVNVPFPNQENRFESTLRPAIVIEDLVDEVQIIFMTCETCQQSRYPNSFIVPETSVEGVAMGLTCDALIAPSRQFTLPKIKIHPRPRGRCPQNIIEQIVDAL